MPGPRNSRDYRDVDGILLLDKPKGLSSNQALQQVRKLYAARKAGHCGSLDPLATGVLPICLGEATKFSSYLLGANKAYRASCRLGQTTSSGDAEGEILETAVVAVEQARIEQVLAQFIGEIEQIPPMYSALKHQGKRLYQLARAGQEVERAPRAVTIFHLDLLGFDGEILDIDVSCSKGTYIRTLAEDIGKRLGCGAHISALHRSRVGAFDEREAVGMAQLQHRAAAGREALDGLLLPVCAALEQYPRLDLDAARSVDISHGRAVLVDTSVAPGLCRLHSPDGHFLGLGEVVENGQLKAKRLMNTAR
jgi:tRNA pseudouridine55 synthase